MTERSGETIVHSSRENTDISPKKVIHCKGSKPSFGDSCVSPGCLDDLAQDLGESMHESVIALIPANRPGNLAHVRLGAATGTELRPCILWRFVEPGLIRKEEHGIDTLCPLKGIWGTSCVPWWSEYESMHPSDRSWQTSRLVESETE